MKEWGWKEKEQWVKVIINMIQTSNCVQKFDLVKQRTCCCPYSSHRNHFPCLLFFFTCAASLSSILYSFIVLLSHFNLVPIHPDLSAWPLHKQQRHVVRIHNQKEKHMWIPFWIHTCVHIFVYDSMSESPVLPSPPVLHLIPHLPHLSH